MYIYRRKEHVMYCVCEASENCVLYSRTIFELVGELNSKNNEFCILSKLFSSYKNEIACAIGPKL